MQYQLKITLLDTDPLIWRRILVPEHFTFYRLHKVIQVAMGWQDYHLFQFHTGEFGFSDYIALSGLVDEEDKFEAAQQRIKIMYADRKRIKGYFSRKKTIYYTYDYGDLWQHQVEREQMIDQASEQAKCIGGQGACPAEDCGGIDGFYNMLRSLDDPSDPENQEWRTWLGLSSSMSYEEAFGFKRELANLLLKEI